MESATTPTGRNLSNGRGTSGDSFDDASPLDPIRYVQVRYGYFSAWQFLYRFERDRTARSVADRYSQELARLSIYRTPVNFMAVAHSNGTYALARALEEHPNIHFDRIYLCGSVLTRNLDWNILAPGAGISK